MKPIRCGVGCAHAEDVHDCERCKNAVAFLCDEACTECALAGADTCNGQREENGTLTRDAAGNTIHPQHVHDCRRCRFLGRYSFDGPLSTGDTEHFEADLYVCPEQVLGPSLLGRFSDDGPDYTSCPMSILMRDEELMRANPSTTGPALMEALDRYRKLTVPEGYEVKQLGERLYQVTGPDFRQTWKSFYECACAARDHAKDGTVVSPCDD